MLYDHVVLGTYILGEETDQKALQSGAIAYVCLGIYYLVTESYFNYCRYTVVQWNPGNHYVRNNAFVSAQDTSSAHLDSDH